jgi:uncharacterized membrane protein YdbT with pleckstrin-like domain
MEENNTDKNISQTISANQGYQTLGKKVFWMFFLQISPVAFILFIISIVLFFASFQPLLLDTTFGNIQNYVLMATFISLIASILIAILCSVIAWLTYINFVFSMGEDSFKIRKGILSKTENAIPYRQIQNVDIERDFMFQILGLSRLVILTAGHEDENDKEGDEAEGIIPAIDQKLASWLQTELLNKSNIQKTVQVNNQSTKPT